jgi:hypothetical protein
MTVQPIDIHGINNVKQLMDIRDRRRNQKLSTGAIDDSIVNQVPHMLARIEELEADAVARVLALPAVKRDV